MPDGPTVIPEEARTLERAVHATAQDLGFNIAGIARLDDIGYTGDTATRVTLTVPIDGEGRPTHVDGNSGPITTVMQIDAMWIPLGGTSEEWVPVVYTKLIDVPTKRLIRTHRNGPDHDESAEQQAGREPWEYLNDEDYVDWEEAQWEDTIEDATRSSLSEFVSGGRVADLSRPWRQRPSPRQLIAGGVGGALVVAVGLGLFFGLGGGGDDPDNSIAAGANTSGPVAASSATGNSVSASSTDSASGISDTPRAWRWSATKVSDEVLPPEPLQPVPIGVMIDGIMPLTAECDGDVCQLTSLHALEPFTTSEPLVPWPWVQNPDGSWTLETRGYLLSSDYANGNVCIIEQIDTWHVTIVEGSDDTPATFSGTLRRDEHIDPERSAQGIRNEYCPPYAPIALWEVTAEGSS